MEKIEYYKKVFEKLERTFEPVHYVLAYGEDLRLRDIAQGRSPRRENDLMVTVEPKENLRDLTCGWGLEVFSPLIAYQSNGILSVLDFEIALDDQRRLYENKGSQLYYFNEYIKPVVEFIGRKLENFNIPYALDLTPSGGHFLFWVRNNTSEWNELQRLGSLEDDLIAAYNYFDPNDLKRNPRINLDAGYVYSGVGKLWEYICHEVIKNVRTGHKGLPVTMSDPEQKCVNLDISCYGDPAFMRIIRTPFSLHKKRAKYVLGAEPLVDVMFCDHTNPRQEINFDHHIDCMWDLELAVQHAESFSGYIPFANENLLPLIEEYRRSRLFEFHERFSSEKDLPRQEAFTNALRDTRLHEKTQSMLTHPNPRALDPKTLLKFIEDLKNNGWRSREIGNLIADLYEQPQHSWNANWHKYPSRTKGHFWSRIYCGLLEEGLTN